MDGGLWGSLYSIIGYGITAFYGVLEGGSVGSLYPIDSWGFWGGHRTLRNNSGGSPGRSLFLMGFWRGMEGSGRVWLGHCTVWDLLDEVWGGHFTPRGQWGGGGYRSLEGQWGPPLQFPVWTLGGAVLNVFLGAFSHRGPAASPPRTAAAQLRPAASSGTDPHRCAEPPAACRDVARASHEHRTPISRSSHTRCTPVLHT